MIQARLRFSLPNFTLDTDLHCPAQGITVLFGASGSGKTTLLRCIAGLDKAQQGFVKVNGTLWQDSARGVFRPPYQRALGYVFQEASLFPHLSVQGNIDYGRKRCKGAMSAHDLQPLIDLLGIGHLLTRRPAGLSGGERQRVAIARALALNPSVLLMDEPLAALDMARKQAILPFLNQLQQSFKIPILYVTHSPQEVTQLADYLVLLEQGKVLIQGDLQTVLTQPNSPLTQSNRAASVLNVTVRRYEAAFHLLHTQFAGGELLLPSSQALNVGETLRVRVYARDISLSLTPPAPSSVLNTFRGQISHVLADEAGYSMVRLMVGETPLLARITRKSAVEMGLAEGMMVYAQVKASALL